MSTAQVDGRQVAIAKAQAGIELLERWGTMNRDERRRHPRRPTAAEVQTALASARAQLVQLKRQP